MRAAANSPIAVASCSTAGDRNVNSREPNTHPFPPLRLVNSATEANHFPNSNKPSNPSFVPSRPFPSSADPKSMPVVINRPVSSAPPATTIPSNQPVGSATETNSTRIQAILANSKLDTDKTNHLSAPTDTSRVISPRRRKKHGDAQQSPKNSQNAANTQGAPNAPDPGRVLVTGYPNYTQPHDILEVFTKFGNVRLDKCNNWSATLTYASDEQAKSAIAANKRVHIYGHFLSVRPYSSKLRSEEGPQSPKRDFSKTKQKSVIIEPSKIDLSGDFHSQLDMIMAAIRLNQEDINRISVLYGDLENAFQVQWPGCKAIPFGSITTGLGIKTSDADCFINLPPQYRSPHGNHVNKAKRLLMQYPNIFAEILAIPRANTPIVKFYHVPTDINCDLTFKTPLGAQNSRLIAFLLHADPRITPVAVIIKYWAKVHDLSGTGKLTNYALTMMIIFYLQQPPMCILPSVEWLQRNRANDIHVDFWNTGFMSDPSLLPPSTNTSTISELLGGFFEYYSIFNFDEMVVCPYLGVPIKKDAFKDAANLPCEFNLYKTNVLHKLVMPIRYQTSFCVQDPFEQCHNVSSTITSKLALDIKTFFKFAANAYEKEKLNKCTGFLKTILLEKPKLIRPKTHPEYRVNLFPRIINTIICFDWKAIVRKLTVTIFEDMMKIKLGKVEEKVNPDSRKEKEKFMGHVTKPIWKRKKYNSIYIPPDVGIEEKQSLISEELIKKETTPVNMQFQLTLTFCHDPKSAVISIRMGGGDLDAFREFGKFFISVMQSWFTQLLKPYSMPNCKDTAAKIAETVDGNSNKKETVESDDEDEDNAEIEIIPSTRPSGVEAESEGASVVEAVANSSDDAELGQQAPLHSAKQEKETSANN